MFVEKVRALIHVGDVRISEHGYEELAEDKLSAREVLDGAPEAILVEEYPDLPKGPHALFLQKDRMWECRYMLYGASQKVMISPWCCLRPIDRIPQNGMKRLLGGVNDETA
jgi:hypothetical protein